MGIRYDELDLHKKRYPVNIQQDVQAYLSLVKHKLKPQLYEIIHIIRMARLRRMTVPSVAIRYELTQTLIHCRWE